jgi:hypothetical protein
LPNVFELFLIVHVGELFVWELNFMDVHSMVWILILFNKIDYFPFIGGVMSYTTSPSIEKDNIYDG